MHCSVVIRAYNEEKHIGRLLEGIGQQTIQNVEVVLVDSGSTDATATIAAQHGAKVVHILPEEFTFGRSLNLGINATTCPWVIIASAHVYPVYPDWLERLLEPLSDPKIALAYGKQRGAQATLFSEHQILAQWYTDRSQPRQAHPFCNNANAAIQRNVWEAHSYDETLTGLEDLAWAQWAMRQGHGIAYIAEAEVVHVHHETPRGVYNRYRREAMAFKHLYPHERFHLWNFVRLSTTNIASDLWHATRQGVLQANLGSIFWFRLMQFWGTYRGYRHPGPLTWKLRQTFYYPRGIRATSQIAPRNVEPIQYNG
jgi:rhamnosyltransferase